MHVHTLTRSHTFVRSFQLKGQDSRTLAKLNSVSVDFVFARSSAVTSATRSFLSLSHLWFDFLPTRAIFSRKDNPLLSQMSFYEPQFVWSLSLSLSSSSVSLGFTLSRRYSAALTQRSRNTTPSSSRSSAVRISFCQRGTTPG